MSDRDTARLATLARYDVLDTPPEESFDRITRLARRLFGVSMSTVTFLDGHRQWFKSRQGVTACETARGPAFCRVVVEQEAPLVVPDTALDPRFVDNPFVTGEPHLRFYAGVPLRMSDRVTIGTLCAMDTRPRSFAASDLDALTDLAAIAIDALELRALAETDALTGAASRRAFRAEIGRAVKLARRHKYPLTCMVMDLDHFKEVNDQQGHAVGDALLAAVIEACRGVLRESDVLGRLGGDEFAVILPHTGAAQGLRVAGKMRAAIAAVQVPGSAGPVAVTASLGVAQLDPAVKEADDLLAQADAALYDAKAAGRDRQAAFRTRAETPTTLARRVFKAGVITFNAGHSSIDCTVRSLSDAGAAIEVVSSAGIPDSFKLQIGQDGLSRACRVAAKREKRLEVEFA